MKGNIAILFALFAGFATVISPIRPEAEEMESPEIVITIQTPKISLVVDERVADQEEITEHIEPESKEMHGYDSIGLLCGCVEAEAANQGLEGKRLVADVVLNRVDDSDFPDTVEDVIMQPHQFETYSNGMISKALENGVSEETKEAVLHELLERSYPGLLYFKTGGFGPYGTPWRQVGDHFFCTK